MFNVIIKEQDFLLKRAFSQQEKEELESDTDDSNQRKSLLDKPKDFSLSPLETKAERLSSAIFAKDAFIWGYEPQNQLTKKTFFFMERKNLKSASLVMNACKKNLFMALKEHRETLLLRDPYISLDELKIVQTDEGEAPVLILSEPMISSNIGTRETNQDAEIVTPIKSIYSQGILLGILDGHGGDNVSNFAKQVFPKIFHEQLVKTKANVRIAFENTFREIQKEIYQNHKDWTDGSVAVICYLDLKTNLLYTATLGDSEAFVYRQFNDELKSIPLSVVRNWKSKKEALRGIRTGRLILNDKAKSQRLLNASRTSSLNVSRAIGDVEYYYEGNGVIQKSKVSVLKVKKGDILLLKCDGVVDSLHESDALKTIRMSLERGSNIADDLVLAALNSFDYSNDNVSVIALCIN